MPGSEQMSKVDRKQKERLKESNKIERRIIESIKPHCNKEYPGVYDFMLPKWFRQFNFWLDISQQKLSIKERPPEMEDRTNFAGQITETNFYNNYGTLHAFTGRLWEEATAPRAGLIPDGFVKNIETGNSIALEHKNQQDHGNAHERATKYLAKNNANFLKNKLKTTYIPVAFIISGNMTKSDGYVREWKNWTHGQCELFVWEDLSPEILIDWFDKKIKPIIDSDGHLTQENKNWVPTIKF